MQESEKKITGVIPATDILETEDGFQIIMDMPGVSPESLTIDIEESELTIRGKSGYAEPDNLRHLHREFSAQEFSRSFTLSDLVDHDKVKATLKYGVLSLFLPKAEAMKPRRIQIS
ncbi:Hsp20/alpha crystallin family protein [Desulfovibrio sp. OttesenSCG-928-C14]|nr:Hsp20/alpha crystallin family protein [Desulfovibrio sp. OttesenSCG-928-C14]